MAACQRCKGNRTFPLGRTGSRVPGHLLCVQGRWPKVERLYTHSWVVANGLAIYLVRPWKEKDWKIGGKEVWGQHVVGYMGESMKCEDFRSTYYCPLGSTRHRRGSERAHKQNDLDSYTGSPCRWPPWNQHTGYGHSGRGRSHTRANRGPAARTPLYQGYSRSCCL